MLAGKFVESRDEFGFRQLAKILFDDRTDIVGVARSDPPSTVRNDYLAVAMFDNQSNRLTSQKQVASVSPLAWCLFDLYSIPLSGNPALVLAYKLFGFTS